MPVFSAFTPFGMLAFSSAPSRAESIYDALVAMQGGQYDLTPGGHQEAETYMVAMSIARARYALERAENQYDPLKAIEMLPSHERDYGVVPGENDTILTRQRNVAARELVSRGSRIENLTEALGDILGDAFVEVRVVAQDDALPLFGPSNFVYPPATFKLVRITASIVVTDAPIVVPYVAFDPAAPAVLVSGDVITVQPENNGTVEQVTVVAATSSTFTATFTNAHDIDCAGTTGSYPNWSSTQRFIYVVAAASVVLDAETIRRVEEFMSRTVSAVTQWALVCPTSPGATTIGSFTVGSSALGTTTLGQIAL